MTDWVKKALTRRTTDKTATIADEVPPSERLVLGVKFAITLTFSLTAIEIAHLALLGTWNSEVFAAITGLAGTITGHTDFTEVLRGVGRIGKNQAHYYVEKQSNQASSNSEN